MRGKSEIHGATLGCLTLGQRVPQGHPLRAMLELVGAALNELSPLFDALYAKRMGRAPIAPPQLDEFFLDFDLPRRGGD